MEGDKNKEEITSFEDLKAKLVKNQQQNKYILEDDVEEKIHNNISFIYNYESQFGNDKEKTILFTRLSLILIEDLTLQIMENINRYISNKYNKSNFKLKNRIKKNDYRKFSTFLETEIKNSKDEKIIRWVTLEFLEKLEFIESTLLIENEENFLRLEKIVSNYKKSIDDIESIENIKTAIELIQNFYDLQDKLYKNKFIGELNRLAKKIFKAMSDENNNWEMDDHNRNKIKREYKLDDKIIKEMYEINKNTERKDNSDFEKSEEIEKDIFIPEGEL